MNRRFTQEHVRVHHAQVLVQCGPYVQLVAQELGALDELDDGHGEMSQLVQRFDQAGVVMLDATLGGELPDGDLT